MAHVTFIHGIANKPAPDVLQQLWLDGLARESGLDLPARGVSVAMVYWADVLYPAPLTEEEITESLGGAVPALEGVTSAAAPLAKTPKEAELIAGLALSFGMVSGIAEVVSPLTTSAPVEEATERIPLPGFVKKRVMEAYLRDVHHYLFNVEFSPRPGESFKVRDEIRARFVKALTAGQQRPGPHVVVSHSMGTVIAYDCLKQVAGCPAVDGLMTVGSPLGLDEVQDGLTPGWTRENGFPSDRLSGEWVNVFDRLDPVAGFDPQLASDFLKDHTRMVTDIHEPNFGRWRHDISKYLRGLKLRASLERMLSL